MLPRTYVCPQCKKTFTPKSNRSKGLACSRQCAKEGLFKKMQSPATETVRDNSGHTRRDDTL